MAWSGDETVLISKIVSMLIDFMTSDGGMILRSKGLSYGERSSYGPRHEITNKVVSEQV